VVQTLIDLSGKRENILDYTIGDSNLVLLETNDPEKVKLEELQESDAVVEAILRKQHLTLHLKDGLKDELSELLMVQEEAVEEEEQTVLQKVMNTIQGIFTPILTPLAGAGILQGITILLTTTGVLETGMAEEGILNTISDAVFYFMPILLAF